MEVELTTEYLRECDFWMRQIHSWSRVDPMDGSGGRLRYLMCCLEMHVLSIGWSFVASIRHI